jgi:hypothetical protein
MWQRRSSCRFGPPGRLEAPQAWILADRRLAIEHGRHVVGHAVAFSQPGIPVRSQGLERTPAHAPPFAGVRGMVPRAREKHLRGLFSYRLGHIRDRLTMHPRPVHCVPAAADRDRDLGVEQRLGHGVRDLGSARARGRGPRVPERVRYRSMYITAARSWPGWNIYRWPGDTITARPAGV